jgi:hypothetical protein
MKGAASGVMKALGNTGIILGIVIFQIAFSETLLTAEAAAQLHDPFTVPMPTIADGFQAAFLLAAALKSCCGILCMACTGRSGGCLF